MPIFSFDNVKVLRTEITTVCNARCGGCARQKLTNYFHMDQSIWSNLISAENLSNIKRLFFNGNYGDFSCHPNSIDYLAQIQKKDLEIVISTNGSTRSLDYWKELAIVLQEFKNHLVIFAIDGVTDDVHSMHRENTKLSKVLENAQSFIQHGANASWQFVTFKENIHQIQQAAELARQYQFKEFLVQNSYQPTIQNSQGQILNALLTPEYISYAWRYQFKDLSLENLNNGLVSNCPWTKLQRLQINADGTVWPCCWVGEPIVNVLDVDFTNPIPSLKNYSLKEIVESNFYQEFFTSKVNDKDSFCSFRCPAKYDDIKFRYRSSLRQLN